MKTRLHLFVKPPKSFLLLSMLCFLLFTNIKCKKDNVKPIDKLPAATQIGANTFGCLVDGKAFLPSVGLGITSTLSSIYDYSTGYLYIYANKTDNKDFMATVKLQSIGIFLQENKTYPLTEYNVNTKASGDYELYYYNQGPPAISYRTDNQSSGSITITKLDLVKRIISGTFAFDAKNGSGEIIHITDGRFDVTL